MLTRDELLRYSRQLNLSEIGEKGQQRLKAARVLCIGAGGLGSPAALYLAAAGVGTIGLVDDDKVDLSNLHRQLLHGTDDVGRRKTDSARDCLRALNPGVALEIHPLRLRAENASDLIGQYDVVVDGSDNLPTRYLSSDVCVWQRKPNVYGSVHQFEGQVSIFAPHLGGPCYRCLFPDPPPPEAIPNCAEAGVLGVVPGVVGLIQALEAMKLILSLGDSLVGRLLHIDLLTLQFREFKLRRDPACPVCGHTPEITAPIDYEQFCRAGTPPKMEGLSAVELHQRLQQNGDITLIDVREPFEFAIGHIPNSKLIPMSDVAAKQEQIPRNKTAVLICKTGTRSAQVIDFLRKNGFNNLLNLDGGIDAWRREVDPTLPQY